MTWDEKIHAWLNDASRSNTQQQLADDAKTSKQRVSALLSGKYKPKVSDAIGFAQAMGTTVETLWNPDVDWPVPDRAKSVDGVTPERVAQTEEEVEVLRSARIIGYKVAMARLYRLPDPLETK